MALSKDGDDYKLMHDYTNSNSEKRYITSG